VRPISLPIDQSLDKYYLDTLTIEPSGLIRVSGWSKSTRDLPEAALLRINGRDIEPNTIFRVVRPDLSELHLSGFVVEFVVTNTLIQSVAFLIDSKKVFSANTFCRTIDPHFNQLFETDQVFRREQIYTSADLPPIEVNDHILRISSLLTGRTLDFGCGRGGLLRELRRRGMDAEGLEIENSALRRALAEGVEEHVNFYDGTLPLPFEDLEFDSIIAAEVLEHIPHFREIVAEIARVTRRMFIVTVPDISSVPACFPIYCVPWHLLEADHCNFFTQRSLYKLLRTHFSRVDIFRICPHDVNDTIFYGSVAAVATKALD
jgi:SAM-dependent methyltransferase